MSAGHQGRGKTGSVRGAGARAADFERHMLLVATDM